MAILGDVEFIAMFTYLQLWQAEYHAGNLVSP